MSRSDDERVADILELADRCQRRANTDPLASLKIGPLDKPLEGDINGSRSRLNRSVYPTNSVKSQIRMTAE